MLIIQSISTMPQDRDMTIATASA